MKDIFADSSDEDNIPDQNDKSVPNKKIKLSHDINEPSALTNDCDDDDCDDTEGYYKVRLGQIMDNKYCIQSFCGQGVFSNVVKARIFNSLSTSLVAIKILRANEVICKAGLKEAQLLTRINELDPKDKHHCVRLFNNFYHRNHLCLVFESLNVNLRDYLRRTPESIKEQSDRFELVKLFGKQLLLALQHLKKCEILHADIKPDNILLDDTFKTLKLCDFGSASKKDSNEPTPYLVSRYYRAPEVIIGLRYDYAMDLWSFGCTIYEIFTGKIMFPGKSNNHMLKLIMDLKGNFSHKIIRQGVFSNLHFKEDYSFMFKNTSSSESNEVTVIKVINPNRDLKRELVNVCDIDYKDINVLKHLLDRIFTLDPIKRPTVEEIISNNIFSE